MILITLFLGTAIALKSDDEPPKGYVEAIYFPPSKPIYERHTLGKSSPHIDEKKFTDEYKYVDETKFIDDKKHVYPIDLHEQSKGYPSSHYFLPTRPLVGKPSRTLGEWYPYNDDRKSYFYPNDLFEQMLSSIRLKRDAAGALRIETNNALPIHADVKPVGNSEPVRASEPAETKNALPIHADVKPVGTSDPVRASEPAETAVTVTEKPCPPSKYKPSHIENGVVFQVTAPEDTIYEVKSLRKSLLTLPNKLEIARSINRIIAMSVVLSYALLELYPLFDNLFNWIYSFVYLKINSIYA